MKCFKCNNDTNHKSGICIACNFNNKFGQRADTHLNPASRHYATKKQTRGLGGNNAGSVTPTIYSNKKLKLFAKAQISYLLSLAYQGNMPVLIKRLHFLQRKLRNVNAIP